MIPVSILKRLILQSKFKKKIMQCYYNILDRKAILRVLENGFKIDKTIIIVF